MLNYIDYAVFGTATHTKLQLELHRSGEAELRVKRKNDAVNKLQLALKHSRPGFICYRIENCRDVGSSLISHITAGEPHQ